MVTNVIELRSKRKELVQEMREYLNRADAEKRALTPDEEKEYRDHEKELDSLAKRIEMEERLSHEEADLKKVANPFRQNINLDSIEKRTTTGKEYRSLWYPGEDYSYQELSNDGFKNIAEFFQAVASQQKDSRLREAKTEARTNVGGTGVAGGFSVPEAFTEILLDRALIADEIFRPRALVLPMEGPTVTAPRFDGDDRSDGTMFGLELKFYGENSNIDVQTAKLKSQTLIAKKGAIDWEESRELVQDSPAFHSKLMTRLPKVIARGLDKCFYSGIGIEGPQGILYAASTLSVARNTASSILYADVKGLWAKLHSTCHANAVWIINSASVPSLLDLKDANNNSIWHPGMGGSVKDGMPMTLFGRPILYCETAPQVGTSGDICLADLSQYVIGLRQDLIVESSNAPGWSRDVISFRITIRIAGQAIFSDPLKMEDGSFLSWAAILS